ncbi:MAG: SUMF1/EgtB/PvdO family nonheme iron enzyme [Candidatus Hydrogenedentes bacterium]|nr:SUMF1/EgtB/PvdO family nonheme iron enzyme [Candidatus Hydrogenedentota bacterium]
MRFFPHSKVLSFFISLAFILSMCNMALGQPPRVAFLAAESALEEMGPHNLGGWESAKGLCDAVLLFAAEGGVFRDASGQEHGLGTFDAVWYHQGDSVALTALHGGAHLSALRAYVEGGGGVLLSGGALAVVDQLGLERDVRAQRHDQEHYRDPAALVMVERAHPAFAGLKEEGGLVWLGRGGCRAVADFYWGGPGEGMLLANTPRGVERPLVEYGLGKGRIIVFGGRWPDYADQENPHRDNLLRLTKNLLAYLAAPDTWMPVRIRTKFPALAHPETPGVSEVQWRGLRDAIEDLAVAYPERYRAGEHLARLEALQKEHDAAPADERSAFVPRFAALQREALLANPLLDFDRLLMIRRRADRLGLPLNYHGNDDIEPTGYENTLVCLSGDSLTTVFQPEGDVFIGDLDLHYDAEKALLSVPDASGRWGVCELDLTTGALARLPLIDEPDVHNYDACYLPDGRIVFTSTAPFIGVPCLGGRSKVANLYLLDHDGAVRRLTNDQDHNWCPAVMNDGRILYQRWEYADIAHAFTRLLFSANPDGGGQMEYYGSNSFWPTALFYARPVPGHPTMVAAVAGGHHDAPRQGELVLLDPALGRHETSGVVQRIPGRGERVEPVILDGLVSATWPRFLHPYPLSDKYFLVSCKPENTGLWGVYLVDVFDNFVLLHEEPGWAMMEPTPWRKTPRPPVIPDRAIPGRAEASVMLTDIYHGPGLAGVPRGSVKSLRLTGYDFTFHGMGCEPDRVGLDGPWDVKRIIGTVPVEADGSAHFTIPALTPVSIQPLDAEGKALALMRSWMTAVPGETLSCVGCHEKQNNTARFDAQPMAFRRAPSPVTPWHGPARGFSFEREVQPVLDAHCVECHGPGKDTFDLTARPAERVPSAFQMHFSPAYMELRRWVHTPTLESDAHLLPARAFHADTSRLIQILRDGHYGVQLDGEAWDRLITWIDLNAPFHGTWREVVASDPVKLAAALHGAERRRTLHHAHAGMDEDPEAVYPPAVLEKRPAVEMPVPAELATGGAVMAPMVTSSSGQSIERVDLAEGVFLELVRIAPGEFVMGSDHGYPNEAPARSERIAEPFMMGIMEVTNAQYRCFEPTHDSGLVTGEGYQFGDDERGFTLNRPEQPVVRVSWERAAAFCEWLSEKTGRRFSLPTEAQWEYACRAGTTTPLWYGTVDTDFGGTANFSDATHHTVYYPHVPAIHPPWRPAETRFDDTWRVSAPPGTFAPNPWGLRDMHGNVAEWTRSAYDAPGNRKVVRGGSWMDCPRRGRSAFRLHYAASQAVIDVGFRVVAEP